MSSSGTDYRPVSQAESSPTYGSTIMSTFETMDKVEEGDAEQGKQQDTPNFVKNKQTTQGKVKNTKIRGAKGAVGTAAMLALNEMQPQHITNLALFGLERSDDSELTWNWRSVGDLISECNDPSRPPVKGCNKKFIHWKLRRIVENIYFRLFTFLLIFIDVGLVIAEICMSCSGHPVSKIIRTIDLILSVYFVLEVILRIIALTPKVFFSKASWHNIIDFVVVILAFGATIAAIEIIKNIPIQDLEEVTDSYGTYKCENSEMANKGKSFSLILILRFIRIFRFVRLLRIYLDHRNLIKSVRQRISENKRRFQADGYDLDLTYVTTNIIAMSFPSKGTKALYRNKIDNVAKFFEDKHSDEKNIDFMVYNLCSEMEYDHRKFHGHVRRFEIDDHNVPTLELMIELVDDVRSWLQGGGDRERVVALHCKGGKGRTGTMVCAVLIDQGQFTEAMDSLQYFGQRRTDLNVSEQFQGVETYSQIRYVHYFQHLVDNSIKEIPSNPLIVRHIIITGLCGIGTGDGSDFSVIISTKGQTDRQVMFCQPHKREGDREVNYGRMKDKLQVTLLGDPVVVDKDTKFLFQCSTKGVPKGYDDCAFFFWLHTYFLKPNEKGVTSETLKRGQLDNPHKEKTWRVWREDFSVEVIFVNPDQSSL